MKVFLGGTTANSKWRDEIEPMLDEARIVYFNPVVEDWNEDAQKNELYERENSDFCLYTITPKMEGVFSVAEVADDSNKRPEKTILVVLESDEGAKFSSAQKKSLDAVAKMVEKNGAKAFGDLKSAVAWMRKIKMLLR